MKRVEHRQDYRGTDEALPQGWQMHGNSWEFLCIRQTPATCDQRWKRGVLYMSMVLRIRPTARPSISNGSPGCTVMTG